MPQTTLSRCTTRVRDMERQHLTGGEAVLQGLNPFRPERASVVLVLLNLVSLASALERQREFRVPTPNSRVPGPCRYWLPPMEKTRGSGFDFERLSFHGKAQRKPPHYSVVLSSPQKRVTVGEYLVGKEAELPKQGAGECKGPTWAARNQSLAGPHGGSATEVVVIPSSPLLDWHCC